jgi:hypothetical protein
MGVCFQQDRRIVTERRSGKDRRGFMKLRFNGMDRRSYGERRSGYERRRWVRLFLRIGSAPRCPLIEEHIAHQAGFGQK